MITEAIILAGGLGTRLRSVVTDVPKCMAPIHDIPFLQFVIDYALKQGINKIILSVGYKKELIQQYFANKKLSFQLDYCEELEPLGTGGAVKKALEMCNTNDVLILNGDTFFEYSLNDFYKASPTADALIATTPMHNFDRYGSIITDAQNKITAFAEKRFTENGNINTGVYVINKEQFLSIKMNEKFSLEKDYFEAYLNKSNIVAVPTKGYFIDIGIPQDYAKARHDLPHFFEL